MKLYQVTFTNHAGLNDGFAYRRTRKAAQEVADNYRVSNRNGRRDAAILTELIINPSPAGIVRLLEIFAAHPKP